MKNVISILLVFLAFFHLESSAQSSDKLKKEQKKLEKEINQTKSLLSKTKNKSEKSLNELKLIENQIKSREQLVSNFDNQVRVAEATMQVKKNEVQQLRSKLEKLKKQYRKLLIYAYKHRNKYGQMMFIFSSDNYNEAFKRNEYVKRVSALRQKQFRSILQHQDLVQEQLQIVSQEKEYKSLLLNEKIKEKEAIEKDKHKQEIDYKKIKAQESKLLAKLKETEKKKEALKKKISAAIQQEIAASEKKKKKKDSTKSNNTSAPPKTGTGSKNTTSNSSKVVLTETGESNQLGKNFESNKSKLPWPVSKGSITEKFGKNPHPTLSNVYTNNNGVDITTTKNATVRAVFEGEVTSVLNIPGAGKVVIIKHGNYRTVYSNLQSTNVSVGSKITTKQSIGTLLPYENTSYSLAHFEIHLVSSSGVQCLNPSLWISQ